MRILLLSPNQINRYNWGHELFRQEIGKHHDVIYYGPGFPNFDDKATAPELVAQYKPQILLTYGLRYTLPFQDIGKVKSVKKAHIVVDLFPPHPAGYKGGMEIRYRPFVTRNKYDIFFYRQRVQEQHLKTINAMAPAHWLPFSVDINKYRKLALPKKYDVLTSATVRNDVYPNRKRVNKLVKKMALRAVTGRVVHERYIRAINQSRIAIISTNVFNSPNMKFTEFTSCGTFVLSDKPADMKQLGFKDGEHLVLYKDIKDLENKITYFLKHKNEREEIALNGMRFTRKKHNNTIRVNQFTRVIKNEFNNGM